MKPKNTLLVWLLIACTAMNAQSLIITYKEETSVRDAVRNVDLSNVPAEFRATVQAQLATQSRQPMVHTMRLLYRNGESLYEPVETQNQSTTPPPTGGGNVMVMGSMGNRGTPTIVYKNHTTRELIEQETIVDRTFLIVSSFVDWSWELQDEEQIINGYKARKATRTTKTVNANNTGDTINSVITAWYSLDIPISDGPGMFYGLPGLIVKLEIGPRTITIDKIEEMPARQRLRKPSRGRKVTREEFNEIRRRRLEEMGVNMGAPGQTQVRVIQM